MTESSRAASATWRAIGPATSRGSNSTARGHIGTRPGDVRKPTTLHQDAGLRSEPPTSVPSANGSMPHATATAAPPLLPPQVRSGAQGLRVAPKTRLKVCEPAANSGVLVLPMTMAPAARRRST